MSPRYVTLSEHLEDRLAVSHVEGPLEPEFYDENYLLDEDFDEEEYDEYGEPAEFDDGE